MKKIAIIGDKASVMGFMAAGFRVFFAEEPETAAKLLKEAADSEEYAIIFITDILLEKISDIADKYASSAVPAIIPLPSKSGRTGYGRSCVKSAVERAVGADIIFRD